MTTTIGDEPTEFGAFPALVNHARYAVDGPSGFDRGERKEVK